MTISRWTDLLEGRSHIQDRYGNREQRSTLVRAFAPGVVPGLLQTADYSRWLATSGAATSDPDCLAAGRQERQSLFGQSPQRRFELLFSWQVMYAIPFDLLFAQTRHIDAIDNLPDVEVRLLHQQCPPWMHGFVLYSAETDFVEIELDHAELTLNAPEDVAVYEQSWQRLWDAADPWSWEVAA